MLRKSFVLVFIRFLVKARGPYKIIGPVPLHSMTCPKA
jgi:hypothetical protein